MAEAKMAEEGAGEGAGGGPQVHKDNPWRSSSDQSKPQLKDEVLGAIDWIDLTDDQRGRIAALVASGYRTIMELFKAPQQPEEFKAKLKSWNYLPKEDNVAGGQVWETLEALLRDAGVAREAEEAAAAEEAEAAAEAAEAPEPGWREYLAEPGTNYVGDPDTEYYAPYVKIAQVHLRTNTLKPTLDESVGHIPRCTLYSDGVPAIYAIWLVTRLVYQACWDWLQAGHHNQVAFPALITDEAPAYYPPPLHDGEGAGAAASTDTLAPGSTSPHSEIDTAPSPGATISIHEAAALQGIRSTGTCPTRLLYEASELSTEVFLCRDLIDSATGRLLDFDCLKYYRNQDTHCPHLVQYSDLPSPNNWFLPVLRPDLALVIAKLKVIVFLLETKPQHSTDSDQNKALVMAKLSLLRLHLLLRAAGIKDPAAHSFALPVVLVSGLKVQILGCQLVKGTDGDCDMEVAEVHNVFIGSMNDAVRVNEIMFNIVCSLRRTLSEGGLLSPKNRVAIPMKYKPAPPVPSNPPSQNKGKKRASAGNLAGERPTKQGKPGGASTAPEALASLGLTVKPYWPFVPTTDENFEPMEPRLFSGQDLRDGTSVFVKLVDDEDEALLETQLSAELAASCSLFLAPSCAPLALPDRDQHAVVFPMQSGSRLCDLLQLTQQRFLSIARQLTQALSRLSECEILHGDLKPDNMLYLRDGGKLVVLDLGCGEKLEGSVLATGFRGTVEFSAPEVCAFETEPDHSAGYGVEADTFSAGRVLETLLERVSRPMEQSDWRGKMKEAVRSMMDSDPACRPKPADAERLFGAPSSLSHDPHVQTAGES